MNFILSIIKFIKFKPIIKFKKFQRHHNYGLVTLVYCEQTVGWIKMKLGMEVGLSPGHIVLDWDPAPPKRVTALLNFRPMSVVAKWLDGLRCHLV